MIKILAIATIAASALGLSLTQDPVVATTDAAASRTLPIEWAGDTIHAVEVSDLQASVRWYRDVLGCELVVDLSTIGWCEVSTPVEGTLIGLGQKKPGSESKGPGSAQLSFGVRNIGRSAEWLRSKGVEIGEIMEIPETVKLLEFTDPDGNRLMFHQVPESH